MPWLAETHPNKILETFDPLSSLLIVQWWRVLGDLHYLVDLPARTWALQEEYNPPCLCWTPARVQSGVSTSRSVLLHLIINMSKDIFGGVGAPWRPPCNWSPRPPPGSSATSPGSWDDDDGARDDKTFTWQKSVKEREPVPSSILLIISCTYYYIMHLLLTRIIHCMGPRGLDNFWWWRRWWGLL